MRGRFAPSPTGRLHLGNLRTALVAWLSARSQGGSFVLRMEDLDGMVASTALGRQQLADLSALGIDWDGDVLWQSADRGRYTDAVASLASRGLTYECYCTRREIQEAAQAPNVSVGPSGAYPGFCRELSDAERAQRRSLGRPPAVRLRADGSIISVADRLVGGYSAAVDDLVLVRNDGTPAYNLAVVVDDIGQQVTEVVRGDDLLSSTPRQIHLTRLLGGDIPTYLHVPLVLGTDGARLAKRHGAVTLADVGDPAAAMSVLAVSLGLAAVGERVDTETLLGRFDVEALPRSPWVWRGRPN